MAHDILRVYDAISADEERIDFIGRGNVWVEDDYSPLSMQLVQSLMYDALANTAPGQLNIIGYDSSLTGIFAPFSALSTGEHKVLEYLYSDIALVEKLQFLSNQIRSTQNVIQGRERSLIDFREKTGRAVEGYYLVVLALDFGIISDELCANILQLMNRGPAYGVTFLVVSTRYRDMKRSDGTSRPVDIAKSVQHTQVLVPAAGTFMVERAGTMSSFSYRAHDAAEIIDLCAGFQGEVIETALPLVEFYSLKRHSDPAWRGSSIDGITFSVGKYGDADVDITIGDEVNQRHNVLITGAVGQGKSNLLSVIIHSLCSGYSPDDLSLYLLDFKEGVTFKPFANVGTNEYLPHVRALGLESDVEFGLAVLDHLFGEYQRRMRELKRRNCRSIKEYRKANPAVNMPRIVVIIDEFQLMFGEDPQTGQRVADLLEKSVRLFRAAGIHFILSSQTLSGNIALAQKRESIFGQVPIRIALKNSVSESQQTLSVGNVQAAYLRPREAIVNLDYGEISQNKKTVIAFADEKVLAPKRTDWWRQAYKRHSAPFVFESERRISVAKTLWRAKVEFSRRDGMRTQVPKAYLGTRISVTGEQFAAALSPEPGRNIALFGSPDSECNNAQGMLQAAAATLAAQLGSGARYLFCDFASGDPYSRQFPEFTRLMEEFGAQVEDVDPAMFDETLQALTARLREGGGSEPTYVFAAGMDSWKPQVDSMYEPNALSTFLQEGPLADAHFIGWWVKDTMLDRHLNGMDPLSAFNTRVFLRVPERMVQRLANVFAQWSPRNNRALGSDSVELSEEVSFIPFAPVSANDVRYAEAVAKTG